MVYLLLYAYVLLCVYGGETMKDDKFTLAINGDLLKQIKVRAIIENRSVADIIEELLIKYLDQVKNK